MNAPTDDTTTEPICPHTLLPASTCAHCRGLEADFDIAEVAEIRHTTTRATPAKKSIRQSRPWEILDVLVTPIDCTDEHTNRSSADLCPWCLTQWHKLTADYRALRVHLQESAARQVNNGPNTGSTGETPLLVNLAASDLLRRINALVNFPPTRWSLLELSTTMLDGITLLDRTDPDVYAGTCPVCHADLRINPTDPNLQCQCGYVTSRDSHIDEALRAFDRWLTYPELQATIGPRLSRPQLNYAVTIGYVDTLPLTRFTLDGRPFQHTAYRLSDVLAWHPRQDHIDQTCATLPDLAEQHDLDYDTIKKRVKRHKIKPRGRNHAGASLYLPEDTLTDQELQASE